MFACDRQKSLGQCCWQLGLQLARVAKEETQQAQDKATGRRWHDAAKDPQNGNPYAGIALGYGDGTGAASSSGDDAGGDASGAGRYEGQSTLPISAGDARVVGSIIPATSAIIFLQA